MLQTQPVDFFLYRWSFFSTGGVFSLPVEFLSLPVEFLCLPVEIKKINSDVTPERCRRLSFFSTGGLLSQQVKFITQQGDFILNR